MDIVYDVENRALTIDYPNPEPDGTTLRAIMAGGAGRHELNGLKMGVRLIIAGRELGSLSYPPEGQKLAASDRSVILSHLLKWAPNMPVRVEAWCTHLGETLTAEIDFFAPQPAKPFPSWVWSEGAWVPPVPYPSDAQVYDWNEASGVWVIIE